MVADDVSQNALSTFVGAFIFSIVGSIALKNGYYGEAGYFTLFVLTILVFAGVILVFLRWVERISKLGRLEHTITRVEAATVRAFGRSSIPPGWVEYPILLAQTGDRPFSVVALAMCSTYEWTKYRS